MSETMSQDCSVIEDLKREEMNRVFHHLRALGYHKGTADRGAMVLLDVPLRYNYRAERQRLELELLGHSKWVTHESLAALVRREAKRPLEDSDDIFPAADNHVEITIDNQSDKVLVNSGETVKQGVSKVLKSRITPGEGEDEDDFAFVARSKIFTLVGAAGTVTYQIDPQTSMTIHYYLFGTDYHQCSGTLSGMNATSYEVKVENTKSTIVNVFDGGPYCEMKPVVTLKKAKKA